MTRQEYRDDTVQLATRIPKMLHVRVRVHALDVGRTMADFVSEALTEYLNDCRKPPNGPRKAPPMPPS